MNKKLISGIVFFGITQAAMASECKLPKGEAILSPAPAVTDASGTILAPSPAIHEIFMPNADCTQLMAYSFYEGKKVTIPAADQCFKLQGLNTSSGDILDCTTYEVYGNKAAAEKSEIASVYAEASGNWVIDKFGGFVTPHNRRIKVSTDGKISSEKGPLADVKPESQKILSETERASVASKCEGTASLVLTLENMGTFDKPQAWVSKVPSNIPFAKDAVEFKSVASGKTVTYSIYDKAKEGSGPTLMIENKDQIDESDVLSVYLDNTCQVSSVSYWSASTSESLLVDSHICNRIDAKSSAALSTSSVSTPVVAGAGIISDRTLNGARVLCQKYSKYMVESLDVVRDNATPVAPALIAPAPAAASSALAK